MTTTPAQIATLFDTYTPLRDQSSLLESIWQDSYGDDYPAAARPNAFYTQGALDQIVAIVKDEHIQSGTLLDVGCSHGRPGIYMAGELTMSLHGIDVSSESIKVASQNAKAAGIDYSYSVGNAEHTDLADECCSVVICLDVLLFAQDKAAAIKEFARVLRPGGILAFTTWEAAGFSARLGAEQAQDHRPLITGAGLEIITFDEVKNAKECQLRLFDNMIAKEAELKQEFGEHGAALWLNMVRSAKSEHSVRNYVLAVARKVR